MHALDWVNAYALAVNEENARGDRWSPLPPTAAPASARCAALLRRFEAGRMMAE